MFIAMAAVAALAAPARAQLPGLALEVRGGASAGNHGGAASEFEVLPGAAWGAWVSYAPVERLSVYAGYGRASFGCETGFCGEGGVTFTSRGVDAGLRVSLPVLPAAGPWVSAGIVHRTLEADAGAGDDGAGWGFSAGGGLELPLGRRLSVTPGVRYVRHGAGDDDAAMVVGDVGLRIRM